MWSLAAVGVGVLTGGLPRWPWLLVDGRAGVSCGRRPLAGFALLVRGRRAGVLRRVPGGRARVFTLRRSDPSGGDFGALSRCWSWPEPIWYITFRRCSSA